MSQLTAERSVGDPYGSSELGEYHSDLVAPDLGVQTDLPCQVQDADLWFADSPADLERAKAWCETCPVRQMCLGAALERREPWGVWGGEIFERGTVIARKRPRGRPRKDGNVGPLRDRPERAA